MDVSSGTLVIYSDIACPWATLCVARLWAARAELGAEDRVHFVHRAFPIELFNHEPTPRRVLDAEIPVVGARHPEFGWSVWPGRADEYPVTTLLALEAVQAAGDQSPAAAEELDLALRRAFFSAGRCISLRSEILAVASVCGSVDAGVLAAALDSGAARSRVIDQWRAASTEDVQGSPHVFLPDGSSVHNPGVDMHWVGPKRGGFPVIDRFDDGAHRALVRTVTG